MTYVKRHKSSYSAGSGESCIEQAVQLDDGTVVGVGLFDSKLAQSTDPVVPLGPAAWTAFVEGIAKTA